VFIEFIAIPLGRQYKIYGSYKPFSNPVIDWMIARSRGRHSLFTVPREEGLMRLVRELKNEQVLFLTSDEDHGEKHSSFAPFFKVPKATLNSPARIAKLANAERFPTMAFYDKALGKYKIIIGKAVDADFRKSHTEQGAAMNKGYEALIRQYPMQYMWFMRMFKSIPGKTIRRY
jgi:lauroyl/myristoyl acyltransferase